MSEWQETTLDKVGQIISGGTPSTKNPEFWDGNIPWITPKDLSVHQGVLIEKGERSITEAGLAKSSAALLPEGTVLFTSRAPIGYIAIAKNKVSTNQGFKSIVCNPKVSYNYFIYYLLKHKKDYIERISSGSTFSEASAAVMKSVEILLPPLNEQNKIAHILSSLDNKIDLLRKQNKTLENIAQTLFKRWFVEFEFPNEKGKPYKSSGGKMVASEVGEIPKGWSLGEFQNLFSVKDGTHDSPKPHPTGYPLVTSKHLSISGIDFTSTYFISKADYDEVNKRSKVDQYDILISMIGTIGLMYYLQESDINFAIKNIGLFKTSENYEFAEYVYLYLNTSAALVYLKSRTSGTTQEYITLGLLREFPIIIPDNETLKRFNKVVKPVFNSIHNNNTEIQTLTKIRDTLLPKLMSGEIRVS